MKKLKLNLSKQESIRLTDKEANSITGGGINRSNRRGGTCRYSRNNPKHTTFIVPGGASETKVTGCV